MKFIDLDLRYMSLRNRVMSVDNLSLPDADTAAAGDAPIITFNRRDFRGGELRFPSMVVQSPTAWLNGQGDF